MVGTIEEAREKAEQLGEGGLATMASSSSVVTPKGTVVEAEVDEVQLPGSEGYLGMLPGHTPLITLLKTGVLSYRAPAARAPWRSRRASPRSSTIASRFSPIWPRTPGRSTPPEPNASAPRPRRR